jgi:hypothetical protein
VGYAETCSRPRREPKDQRGDRPTLLTALVVFAVLAIILPMAVFDSAKFVGDSGNVAMAYLITCYSAFMIAKICYSGAGQITRLAVFLFCYVFMGLAVFVQVGDNQFPLNAPGSGSYTTGQIRHALYTVIIGIAAFEIATIAMRIFAAGNRNVRLRKEKAATPGARLWQGTWAVSRTKVLVLGVFGLVVTAFYLSRTGVAPFFDSRQAASNAVLGNADGGTAYAAANKVSRTVFRVFAQAPIMLSLFGILYMKRHNLWKHGKGRTELGATTVLVLLVVANVIVNGPTGNSRYWFSTVAITLASVYVSLSKAKGIRWAAIGAVLTLLFAFTTLQAFRREGTGHTYSTGFRQDLESSGSYSDFQMELIGSQWIDLYGHTHGRQLLGAIMIFVPRSIWHHKPTDTGNLVLPRYNPAATLWTEGEVEAGWFGVVIYFLALGAATAAWDRRLRAAPPGTIAHATIPIIGGFMILVLRGSILPVIGAAYGLIAVIVFITRWSRLPVPAAEEARSLSVR